MVPEPKSESVAQLELKIESSSSIEEIKAEYGLFTPEEKEEFWRNHVEEFLNEHGGGFNQQQQDYIQDLLDYISPEIFDTTTTEYAAFIATDGVTITDNAITLFGAEMSFTLLVYDDGGVSDSALKCNCSTKSDWCSVNNYCLEGRSNCTAQTGCGTFWGYKCNGRCWQ